MFIIALQKAHVNTFYFMNTIRYYCAKSIILNFKPSNFIQR
nr:MAG TPA: hypothetical protein [Caudoviricetes sp.]